MIAGRDARNRTAGGPDCSPAAAKVGPAALTPYCTRPKVKHNAPEDHRLARGLPAHKRPLSTERGDLVSAICKSPVTSVRETLPNWDSPGSMRRGSEEHPSTTKGR